MSLFMAGYIKIRRGSNLCFVRRGLNNLYHFFPSHELSPLQLFFYGLESPSFWLSKTALLASFGSDGGHWRFFKENECNQPAGESVSYLPFSRGFPSFSPCSPCNKFVALKWSLIRSMWSQNDRRWVYTAQWSILRGWAVKIPLIPDWPCTS